MAPTLSVAWAHKWLGPHRMHQLRCKFLDLGKALPVRLRVGYQLEPLARRQLLHAQPISTPPPAMPILSVSPLTLSLWWRSLRSSARMGQGRVGALGQQGLLMGKGRRPVATATASASSLPQPP